MAHVVPFQRVSEILAKKKSKNLGEQPQYCLKWFVISSSEPHPQEYHSSNTNSSCTLYLYKVFQSEQIHDFLVIHSVVTEFSLCNKSQSMNQHSKHRTFCFRPPKNSRRLSLHAAYLTLMWVGRGLISGKSEMLSEDPFSTIASPAELFCYSSLFLLILDRLTAPVSVFVSTVEVAGLQINFGEFHVYFSSQPWFTGCARPGLRIFFFFTVGTWLSLLISLHKCSFQVPTWLSNGTEK